MDQVERAGNRRIECAGQLPGPRQGSGGANGGGHHNVEQAVDDLDLVADLGAAEDDRVSVTFGPSPNDPCTADMAPTTHEFDLPAGVTSDTITVEIRFEEWPDVYTVTLD